MKTILKIFICISLIYTPFFAFASAAEKWEIVEKVYDESTDNVQVTARKVGATASNDPVYKVRVPVSASDLGKAARAGLFGLGMYAAVEAMLEAVGWILDPLTQSIWRNKGDGEVPPNGYDYKLPDRGNQSFAMNFPWVDSPSKVVTQLTGLDGTKPWGNTSVVRISNVTLIKVGEFDYDIRFYEKFDGNSSGSTYTLRLPKQVNPNQRQPEKEFLSDADLGKEIMGEGQNKVPQPAVITDIYDPNSPIPDSAPKTKTGAALDSANPAPSEAPKGESTPKPNTDTDGDGEPDTYDPNAPDRGSEFTWPEACEWFPAACDFFKVQKQDNKEIKENQEQAIAENRTFFQRISEWFDWTKENDDLPDDEKPQISEIPTPELKEDAIRWSAQCPADAQVPINMQGVSSTITFSWSPWCQLLSMIKPAIVVSAYIGAAFIVLGLRT